MAIKVVCLGLPLEGPAHISVESDPALGLTLRELISRYVAPQFKGDLVHALFDANGLREEFVILVNGRNALGLGGPDSPVQDQSQVFIMPPVDGG